MPHFSFCAHQVHDFIYTFYLLALKQNHFYNNFYHYIIYLRSTAIHFQHFAASDKPLEEYFFNCFFFCFVFSVGSNRLLMILNQQHICLCSYFYRHKPQMLATRCSQSINSHSDSCFYFRTLHFTLQSKFHDESQ